MINRAEFAELDELAAHRQALWERLSEDLIDRSPFYRRLWSGRPAPRKLEWLEELPFSDKESLRNSQRHYPPFGDYLACAPEMISRIHRTGGTTGTAMNLAMSRRDARVTAAVGARAFTASGVRPGDRVVHCLNYRMWMGGYTDHAALEAAGAAVIPFGVGDSQALVRVIRDLNVSVISCTPSYPAVLERVIETEFVGLEPKDLGLTLGLFGGEAALDDSVFREKLRTVWGLEPRNANYGVTDVMCNFAGQCELEPDLHFVALDVLYPELIDPKTELLKPWREGETGELALTHVVRDCQPLVRFRTGDIITLTGTNRAMCGRTTPRFRVIGRTDDMVVVRGINVFPSQIAPILNGEEALSGEYRIVLPSTKPYDVLSLQAEVGKRRKFDGDLADRVAATIKRDLGVTARVTLVAYGALPRNEGKTRRVVEFDSGLPQ